MVRRPDSVMVLSSTKMVEAELFIPDFLFTYVTPVLESQSLAATHRSSVKLEVKVRSSSSSTVEQFKTMASSN